MARRKKLAQMSDGSAALDIVGRDSISLDAVDDSGKPRKVHLKATIIGPPAGSRVLTKQEQQLVAPPGDEANDDPGRDAPTSQAEDDDAQDILKTRGLIRPPFNLHTLASWWQQSTELGQAIKAMVTNVVGFGWQLRERPMPDDMRKRLEKDIERERFMLLSRLETVHPLESLTTLRGKSQWDKHSTGQGYLELIDNRKGDLVGLNHVPAHSMILTAKEAVPTKLDVPRIRPDLDYRIEEVPMFHRFRRFVQARRHNNVAKPIWFKEAGDPRMMDKRTGAYAKKGETIPFRYRATAIVQNRTYAPTTAYGVPLWIGNLYSLLGSRKAEEINYNTLASNGVPSMMVIVENGALTPGSIARLKEWTEQHIQRSNNYSTFLLVEGDVAEDGAPNPGSFKIRIEPLKQLQQQDELYQNYDSNNRDKIRQAFRLPPIFVGRADDYTRATADTSRDIADEQVFAPEREQDDFLLNRFVLSRWGARYHTFRSNHPNITDDIELIRLMAIAERSGAMTPRRADRIIRDVFGDNVGPMPQGLDLDTPFSITFAQAQQGGAGSSQPGGSDVARGVLDGLLKLRTNIEKELDSRFLLEDGDMV